MWNNKQAPNSPGSSRASGVDTLPEPTRPQVTPPTKPAESSQPHSVSARVPSWLGPGLKIKGQISGSEDLQVESKVEGPVSLEGHRLTVGQNGRVTGEIAASEVVIFGEVSGDLLASERIEIKKNGSVMGDLTTTRIVIEDGAYFKGSIEITRKNPPAMDLDTLLARPEKKSL